MQSSSARPPPPLQHRLTGSVWQFAFVTRVMKGPTLYKKRQKNSIKILGEVKKKGGGDGCSRKEKNTFKKTVSLSLPSYHKKPSWWEPCIKLTLIDKGTVSFSAPQGLCLLSEHLQPKGFLSCAVRMLLWNISIEAGDTLVDSWCLTQINLLKVLIYPDPQKSDPLLFSGVTGPFILTGIFSEFCLISNFRAKTAGLLVGRYQPANRQTSHPTKQQFFTWNYPEPFMTCSHS